MSVRGLERQLFCQQSVRILGYARNFCCVRGMFQRFSNKTLTSIKRSCHKLLGIFERRHNFRGLYLKLGCLKRNIIVFQTSTVARALELMIYFPHMDEPVSIDYFAMT